MWLVTVVEELCEDYSCDLYTCVGQLQGISIVFITYSVSAEFFFQKY